MAHYTLNGEPKVLDGVSADESLEAQLRARLGPGAWIVTEKTDHCEPLADAEVLPVKPQGECFGWAQNAAPIIH
jgi:hypothetical protein